jgi:hypothetical protein
MNMSAAVVNSEVAQCDDVVILVHGTYAAESSDEGDSWWQRGSEAWKELSDRLPVGVKLPEKGRLFHWSGENSERSRIKAAGDLLAEMLSLESQGTRYHLIGHSHGGSVIWNSLRLATLRRNSLEGLRSWSTVGTPFMHHRTKGAWHVMNIVKITLALALIVPAVRTVRKLIQLICAALFGTDHGVSLPSDGGIGWISTNRVGVSVIDALGVPVVETANGFRVGSYDPSSQSIVEYVFLTPEGWLILFVALLLAYVYLNLAVFCLGPVLESLRIRKEKRFERKVMEAFQRRWLGLWSPDDEAINGLRATLELSISFVARMSPRESVLFSDRLSLISRPHHWIIARTYNAFARPLLDRVVRSQVVKTAQGNNRPSAEVVAVSTSPVDLEQVQELPSLPDWLNAKIAAKADRHARDIAPKLRALIAGSSFVSGLETFGQTISGSELVHTSYFDHVEVLDLLAQHVAWASGRRSPPRLDDSRLAKLDAWMLDFKFQVGALQTSARRGLIVPRRRNAA